MQGLLFAQHWLIPSIQFVYENKCLKCQQFDLLPRGVGVTELVSVSHVQGFYSMSTRDKHLRRFRRRILCQLSFFQGFSPWLVKSLCFSFFVILRETYYLLSHPSKDNLCPVQNRSRLVPIDHAILFGHKPDLDGGERLSNYHLAYQVF